MDEHGLGGVSVAHAEITCQCGAKFDGFGDRGAVNKFRAHMEGFGLPCNFQEVNPVSIARPEPSILRRITTEEELGAMPVGTVVLSEEVTHHEGGWPLSYQRWQDGNWHRGARSGSTHPDNFLPVVVLHAPPRGGMTQLTRRDREVIAVAYEVDAARARRIPVRNPFAWCFLRAMAHFLEGRAKSIREGDSDFAD